MVKRPKWSGLLLGVCMAGVSGWALADRGHGGYYGHPVYRGYSNVGVGIVIDPLYYRPWLYPGPYYYPPYGYPYPPIVTVPAAPPVYIERAQNAEAVPPPSASWYYCANPQGYYPYVENCPGGWQAVAPRPPAGSGEVK
ncbi:MAG: hypothetical protein GC183_16400 [Thiobacillus sp.]|nr:hypothetical protein [Thiobacillus sp.]